MSSDFEDIQQTREYALSHHTARGMLPFTVGAFLLGSFLIVSHDGSQTGVNDLLFGGLSIAASLAGLAISVYKMRSPTVASIVLSPEGVLFRDVSDKPIPWDEIREVGTAEVSMVDEFSSKRVTKLVVSYHYLRSLGLSSLPDSRVAEVGDPSTIYLSYYHSLPFDEFQTAVQVRWQAFHRRPKSSSQLPIGQL